MVNKDIRKGKGEIFFKKIKKVMKVNLKKEKLMEFVFILLIMEKNIMENMLMELKKEMNL